MATLVDMFCFLLFLGYCTSSNNGQDLCNELGDVSVISKSECFSAGFGLLQNRPFELREEGIRSFYDEPICHIYENGIYNIATSMSGITCSESSRSYADLGCENTYDGNGDDLSGTAWGTLGEGIGGWIQINLPTITQVNRMKFILRKADRDHPKEISITFDGSTVISHTFEFYSGNTVPGPTESIDFDPPHYVAQIKIDFITMYVTHSNIGFAEIMICSKG